MTEIEARARLESMVAAESAPTLSAVEVDELLAYARRVDKYGAWPSDSTWASTYDLNAAAAEGWRWKAGKVVGNFSFATDGDSYSEAQVYAHCLQMAQTYGARVAGSVNLAPDATGYEYVVGNQPSI